jgi:hypothetical protein
VACDGGDTTYGTYFLFHVTGNTNNMCTSTTFKIEELPLLDFGTFWMSDGSSSREVQRTGNPSSINATPLGACVTCPTPTPTPTPATPTPTPTATPTPTPATPTPTPTATPTATPLPGSGYYNGGYGCEYYTYDPGFPTCDPNATPTPTPITNGVCWTLLYDNQLPNDLYVRYRDNLSDTTITELINGLQALDNGNGTYTAGICVKSAGAYSTPVFVYGGSETSGGSYMWSMGSECTTAPVCLI